MLDRIKTRLSIDKSDTLQDDLIKDLILTTTDQLKAKIKSDTVPESLNFIIVEVAIKKYNKIGSEGYKSDSVDVISASYEDDMFLEFKDIINHYSKSSRAYYTLGILNLWI